MEIWKKNLWVCWFAVFVVSSGMSQMAPILPLYIEHLGVYDQAEVARWAGIIFGCNFVSLTIFSPIWGRFADKYGRKPMVLRASLWLSIIMICMGFAQNVYHLAGLRLLQGALSGFQGAAITLVATQTPKEQSGWALGTLFTGQVGGTLLGPLFGGYLSEFIGFRGSFLVIGGLCFTAFFAIYFFVQEKSVQQNEETLSSRAVWQALPNPKWTVCLFVTTMVMQLALLSIQPIITVFVAKLAGSTSHIAVLAGAVFAAAGLASMLAAPRLGKLSDKIGAQKVLLYALLAAGCLFIPQAFVQTVWQLALLRFLLGLTTAGLLPSINSLIRKSTPKEITGRIYGFNQSAQFLGMFTGSILGGQIAAAAGIQYVLFLTGTLLLINALWFYRMIYKNLH
ncbi:MAG: multidrug efflux MFS transporter [Pelosinus sp.]|nr:multidrug efflux MFS transporter [Pelosinus sp.]